MNRPLNGALQATSMLLLVSCCTVSVASAAEISCNRNLAVQAPADPAPDDDLHLRLVDLGSPDASEAPPTPDELALSEPPATPDFSSRARSLAILKEIFGEAAYDDDIDVRLSPHDLAQAGSSAGAESGLPVRQPAAATETEADAATGDGGEPAPSDARLPGVTDEEADRYRHQMYRTDI